jgi:hypothetical protein
MEVGMGYFDRGIPCPFLEEESCSIYGVRPLVSREVLVTSPAEHCACPRAGTVKRVKMPLKAWTAMAAFDEVPAGARYIRWVPLILAPEWAEAHPEEQPQRPGPELPEGFFERLTGGRRPEERGLQAPFETESVAASAREELPG